MRLALLELCATSEHTVEVDPHRMVEGSGMKGFLCILQSLRDHRIIKWEFNIGDRERLWLIDKRPVAEDGASISRYAGPAIGINFLVAHGVIESWKNEKSFA